MSVLKTPHFKIISTPVIPKIDLRSLYCPVYFTPMPDATSLAPCGHSFRQIAISKFKGICPLDQNAFTTTFPNRAIQSFWEANLPLYSTTDELPTYIPKNHSSNTSSRLRKLHSQGIEFYKNKLYEEAKQKFSQILQEEPFQPDTNFNLFLCDKALGNLNLRAINIAVSYDGPNILKYKKARTDCLSQFNLA